MPPPRMPQRQTSDTKEATLEELKQRIHSKLVDKLDLTKVGELEGEILRREIRLVVEHLCDSEDTLLNRSEREQLVGEVLDETFGLGPLELLLKDTTISDIMINGPKNIYCERRGKIEKTNVVFRDNDHLMQIIDRIISKVGRRVDETCPMVDARMLDGSRFNAIIPPLALDGACVSIRRFGANPLKLEDLLNYKAFTPEMVMLLEGAIKARLNIIISGGTGSGKTTLLNTLSSFISNSDRVVTIEDAAELQLQQEHVVRLETRPPNIEGKGAITATDLVKNALRMRPERIIIGECRGGETLDMLQAMNTGHEGSMTTIHANTPRDALSRLETFDHDVRLRSAAEGHADASRQRREPHRAVLATAGRTAQDHLYHGDLRHGAGHDRDARHLPLRPGRHRRDGPGLRPLRGHGRAAQVHAPPGIGGRPLAGQRLPRTGHAGGLGVNPLFVGILIFLGVATIVGGLAMLFSQPQSSRLEDRLDLLAGIATPASRENLLKENSVLARPLDDAPNMLALLFANFANFDLIFEQADTTLTVGKLTAASIALGIAGCAVVIAMKGPMAVVPLAGIAAGTIPMFWLFWRRKRRLSAFNAQLPDALEMIARALRAGQSLAYGFNAVAGEMSAPIGKEFGRIFEEQNLGVALDDSLRTMCKRVPNLDLRFFVTAVILQRQTGGDLSEILDKIGALIRDRFRILGQVQALTGEGRLSGIVLMAMPVVLFLVVYSMNPDYVSQLFTDPAGKKMLAVAVFMQVLGAIVIKKIVNIKV